MAQTIPRQFSTRNLMFDPRAFHVGFVMNEVRVGQSFLRVYLSFPAINIPPKFHSHIFIRLLPGINSLSNWQCR